MTTSHWLQKMNRTSRQGCYSPKSKSWRADKLTTTEPRITPRACACTLVICLIKEFSKKPLLKSDRRCVSFKMSLPYVNLIHLNKNSQFKNSFKTVLSRKTKLKETYTVFHLEKRSFDIWRGDSYVVLFLFWNKLKFPGSKQWAKATRCFQPQNAIEFRCLLIFMLHFPTRLTRSVYSQDLVFVIWEKIKIHFWWRSFALPKPYRSIIITIYVIALFRQSENKYCNASKVMIFVAGTDSRNNSAKV